jgi:magnesium transporter
MAVAESKTREQRLRNNGRESLLIYLSLLLGMPVLDVGGNRVGRVREVTITPGVEPPVVSALVWGPKAHPQAAPPSSFQHLPDSLRLTHTDHVRPFSFSEPLLMLDRDLLDQQIIDVHGRKVVRVNDITLFWQVSEAGGDLRPLEVEAGTRGAIRRLLKGLAPRHVIEQIAAKTPSTVIPWDFVDLIEADPARRVRLKISHDRLSTFHPSDLADILEDLAPAERTAIFTALDEEVAAETLEEVEPKLQKQLVESLDHERAADIMEEMDPSAAADLLGELRREQSEAILEEMEPEERQEVQDLLEFSENSAAGRMTTQYVAATADATAEQAVGLLRSFDDDPETVTALYLVDAAGVLTGVVPLPRLLLSPPDATLGTLAETHFVSCPQTMHDRQVAELFDRYNLYALPVVDEHGVLVGVINADHVIAFLREQA